MKEKIYRTALYKMHNGELNTIMWTKKLTHFILMAAECTSVEMLAGADMIV
jgi:hypothetical protein